MKQNTIDTAKQKLMNAAATGHNDLAQSTSKALEIERRASLMQMKLKRSLPALQKAAHDESLNVDKSKPGYGSKLRAYLQAVQNLNRAEKAYQLARGQRVMAERMQ